MAIVGQAIGSVISAASTVGVGTALTIGGTLASISSSNRAAGAQRRAIQLQQRQQKLAVQRSRRKSIRESQLLRAQQLSAGVASGAQAGSGVAGGGASIFSNLGAAFGFSTAGSGISNQISEANQSAATYNAQAGTASAIAGFGNFAIENDLFATPPASPNLGTGMTRE